MLCCSHCIMLMCWTCIHSYVCLDGHLLCYVIIVVISIWLFRCIIKLLTCFTSCLFDRNLIVTLYLSFYYLLYLEGLMCFVQVFQVTSIYVPSASQLLIILKGRNFKHFYFTLFKFIFSILCLYPCCFCNLLGFVFIFCRLYDLYHALCSLYTLLNQYF